VQQLLAVSHQYCFASSAFLRCSAKRPLKELRDSASGLAAAGDAGLRLPSIIAQDELPNGQSSTGLRTVEICREDLWIFIGGMILLTA